MFEVGYMDSHLFIWLVFIDCQLLQEYPVAYPDNKVHGANMGPTWVLLALDGRHVGPMNLATRVQLTDRNTVAII